MKAHLGDGWREGAIDALLFGDPRAELRGVACTMMATQAAVERAASLGLNLIISHEPLFYSHTNDLEPLAGDGVYAEKARYLAERGICVFHLHDNAHRKGGDAIALGMSKALGWEDFRADDSRTEFLMPDLELGALAGRLRAALRPAALRYIGDPGLAYGHVLCSWGFVTIPGAFVLLNRRESCVLVAGETHEWELAEYVGDAIRLGRKKALVIVGHVPSEERGFESFCAGIGSAFPDIPFRYIETGDLFSA